MFEATTDTRKWKSFTAADLLDYEVPELVKIEKGEIGFKDGDHFSYWVELSRIPNHEALIEWIHHLMGKNWVTKEMLEQFIEKVCSHRKWGIYHGY